MQYKYQGNHPPSTLSLPSSLALVVSKELIYNHLYLPTGSREVVPLEAVHRLHDGKVIVDVEQLDARLREAIAHAHDREEPRA
jgi:hypothetical protein